QQIILIFYTPDAPSAATNHDGHETQRDGRIGIHGTGDSRRAPLSATIGCDHLQPSASQGASRQGPHALEGLRSSRNGRIQTAVVGAGLDSDPTPHPPEISSSVAR